MPSRWKPQVGRHNIHNGIDRAHLVEVDLVDGGPVDGGFGVPEGAEGAHGGRLHRVRQAALVDELLDVAQVPVRMVVVPMVVIVVVIVVVFMAVIVVMMAMAVIMPVVVVVMMVAAVPVIMSVGRAVLNHAELGGVDAFLHDLLRGHVVAFHAQGGKPFLDGLKIRACVDKRAHGHVAADAAIAIEIKCLHDSVPAMRLMVEAATAAPKPLSMLTTVTPVPQELSMPRSAARPPKLAP